MLNKLNLKCKAFIAAVPGTFAVFGNGQTARVQFWVLKDDESLAGIGIYDGNLAALDLLPDFAGFRC